MQTALTRRLELKLPLLQAPMGGGIAGPSLAAAVCKAGGLGMLPIWSMNPDAAADAIAQVMKNTRAPFAVNLNVSFGPAAMVELALTHDVPVIHFFWGDPAPFIPRAKARGAKIMVTVANAEEARHARIAGADILVAQGIEAGGHVRGQIALMALVPAVVDCAGGLPVVAAGAIADGRGLAAALMLGASGAMVGTALAASEESGAHDTYKESLIAAGESDTVLNTLFDIGWPEAPARVLRNETVRAFERAGSARRPGEGEAIAHAPQGFDVPRYSVTPPTKGMTGDIAAMALYAGQGVGLVRRIEPAAAVLNRIVDEAEARLAAGAAG